MINWQNPLDANRPSANVAKFFRNRGSFGIRMAVFMESSSGMLRMHLWLYR